MRWVQVGSDTETISKFELSLLRAGETLTIAFSNRKVELQAQIQTIFHIRQKFQTSY